MNDIHLNRFNFNVGDCQFEVTIDHSAKTYSLSPRTLEFYQSLHFHSDYEIFFVLDNQLSIATTENINVFERGIVYVSPFCEHCSIKGNGIWRFTFSIKPASYTSNSHYYSSFSKIFNEKMAQLPINNAIIYYTTEIQTLQKKPENVTYEKIIHMLSLLFLEIYSTNNKNSKEHISTNENYASQIEAYICKNYNKHISLKEISSKLFLSERQTSRIIQKKYHKSFSEMINDRKLYISLLLLTTTDEPISSIAEFVGYNTENYFYSSFKKKYKCTPLQYRKLHNKHKDSNDSSDL